MIVPMRKVLAKCRLEVSGMLLELSRTAHGVEWLVYNEGRSVMGGNLGRISDEEALSKLDMLRARVGP